MSASTYPGAAPERLVVYAIGPGFGESLVVLTPDGATVVVDACTRGKQNLTALLLTELGRTSIDLLVFSHPDTDHIRGGGELIKQFSPGLVWTYPLTVSLRTHLTRVAREDAAYSASRLVDLHKLLDDLEPLREQNIAEDVQSNAASWRSSTGACEIQPLAPLQRDIDAANKGILAIIKHTKRRPGLSDRVEDFLRGRAGAGDHPNLLSVAFTVTWGKRRVLLGGDVETGRAETSGWRGILKRLKDRENLRGREKLQWLESFDVVKVAHHGSENAFCADAWRLHRKGVSSVVAMVCPFNRSGELPAQGALQGLRSHATRLALSLPSSTTLRRIEQAGWRACSDAMQHGDWDLPVIVSVIPRTGNVELHIASGAGAWAA